MEPAAGQLERRRSGQGMPQQALGCHDDERTRIVAQAGRLATQQPEVLRGSGAVCDTYVVLGGHVEEALEASARVVRALALPGVRQEQHEPALQSPLRLARDHELIDDDL